MSRPEEELFAGALALPSEKRALFLADACGGDAALRARIEALLRAHEEAGSLLDAAPGSIMRAALAQPPAEEKSGTLIGRYKLLQKIGEGGCGTVWMAEQMEPVVRRVALKVIKLGMDTKEVIARFEAERQALALMDHPNIARVLDAGATETGRPFFVMELVRGVKITDYCDQHNLPTAERLKIFSQVCQAIDHAHAKGIVHRDIKPSNILVTVIDGAAVPKVIDFGIAKATQGRLTDRTLFTAFEQFIGTPAYMSPEQAELSGVEIDPRSDIYSLGVLLYELLTGQTPFDAKSLVQAGLDEIRRIIREVEPPKPSARLSTLTDADRVTVAKLRGTAPAQLSTLLCGDLDWIVMRCLEKDRLRRYASAQNLAEDIARHLGHHPVSARPPSVPYRLQKLIRRNRRNLVVAGTALTVGLVAGIGLYLKERRAREDAFAAAQARYAVTATDRSTQAAAPMPADDREKVGALGEPEALDFSGNLSFPARSVRDGLAGASEYLLAAHPLAPLEEYVAVIRQCVVNGYRNHGFPQVGVSTEVDRNKGRVRVKIDEGPRFVQGDVRVEGAGEVPAEEIVRSLTEPAPPMADPLAEAVETALAMQRAPQQQQKTAMMLQALNERIPSIQTRPGAAAGQPMIAMPGTPARDDITLWQRGQPVSFAKTFLGGIEATVRARLARNGHLLANVRAELAPEPAARCAHLVVRVQEGPRAVLGEIRVMGNQRNPSTAIIACAGLNPGMEVTPEMLTRAKLALWNSARFRSFDVTLQPREAPARECDVTIEVKESETMALLPSPLERHEAALVKFANWLTTVALQRELALSVSGARVRTATLAWSPRRGLAVVADGGNNGPLFALLVRPGGIRMLGNSDGHAAGFESGPIPGSLASWVLLGRELNFGANWNNLAADGRSGAGTAAIFQPSLIVTPECARLHFGAGAKPVFENGEVALHRSLGRVESILRFREDTGELVEWTATEQRDETTDAAVPPRQLKVRVDGSEFAEVTRLTDQAWAALPTDAARRLSLADVMVTGPFAEALGAATGDRQQAGVMLARTAVAIRLLEHVFTRFKPDRFGAPPADFNIPKDPSSVWQPNAIAMMFGPMFHQFGRMLGPPDAWPAKLGRELFYLVNGQTRHTSAVLDGLYSDPHMGPLGSLATAQLLRRVNSPLAWRFARRAAERSSVDDFREDCQVLFQSDTFFGQMLREQLSRLASVNEGELAGLTSLLPAADVARLHQALAALRHAGKEDGLKTIQPHLDRWWDQRMRPRLESLIATFVGGDGRLDPAIVAATVNGMPVSRKLLELGRLNPAAFAPVPVSPMSVMPGQGSAQPERTLDALITLTLLLQDAIIQGYDPSDAALDRTMEDVIRTQGQGDHRVFEALLARSGMTLADYRDNERLRTAFSWVQTDLLHRTGPPSEEEITREMQGDLGRPDSSRHVQAISVTAATAGGLPEARSQAEGIRSAALGEGGFAAVYARHDSKAAGQPRRTDFPRLRRGDLQPDVAAIVFALAPGGVSTVIETGGMCHVFHYVDPESPAELQQRRARATATLGERKHAQAVADHIGRLRATAFVQILTDPAPTAINPPPTAGGARFEFEDLAVIETHQTRTTAASFPPKARTRWSGSRQVVCAGFGPDGWAEWEISAASAGLYRLQLFATRTVDSGQVQFTLDGRPVGRTVELFAPSQQPSGAIPLGTVRLAAGSHRLRCILTGKHASSLGYTAGLDALDLIPTSTPAG